MFDCGFTVEDAVKTITETTAELLNVNKGRLEKNRDADIVIFDDNINVTDVFVMGKKVV